ncbi:MAG: hypothetical protein MUP45_04910 [Candidatus Marinimicrobia bacterium]|nr:hypothetical protein [Candidatus Neomarinimicrobiota bacterium]
MEYSSKAISFALIKDIINNSNNNLEKFLLQQNYIQFGLITLVSLRCRFLDRDLRRWIENQTLGSLIKIYKVCAVRNENEVLLAQLLEKYNRSRNYLVHKIVKDCNWKKASNEVVEANKEGEEIMKRLENVLSEMIKPFLKKS